MATSTKNTAKTKVRIRYFVVAVRNMPVWIVPVVVCHECVYFGSINTHGHVQEYQVFLRLLLLLLCCYTADDAAAVCCCS